VFVPIAWLLAVPATTRAACDGPAPSFRRGIETAPTVVVGEVTAVGIEDPAWGRSEFTLRVDHVLRGTAAGVMEIRDLVLQPCAGLVRANVGDVIALALGATEFETTGNPIAFIRGAPPRPDIERVTLAQVFALAGLASPAEPAAVPWALIVGGVAVGLVAIIAFRSRHPR
jgi:hypothetical protein